MNIFEIITLKLNKYKNMSKQKEFKGKINVDIRDSVPDWTPYEQPKAKEGAPNVLFITWDDIGFAVMESFGGLIKTPTMKRISDMGLRYTQFHTTALCSPTRASLLTGRNHTTVGMAAITEGATGFPGSNGHIPFETAMISEVLVEQGYNTYMLGKWHLCPEDEMNIAATKRNWPTGRGFERFYGFLGGETNQWYPNLVQDQQFIEQPYTPEEGYHLSKDLADKAISMIADSKQVAGDKPFFMYFAPGAGHAPHHAPKEWIEKYEGKFDMGYEEYRKITLEKQKEMGIIPKDTKLAPLNALMDENSVDDKKWPEVDIAKPWEELSEKEQKLFCRMAEVFAGFVSYTDYHIGRILDYLEEINELDNTIIIAISDNGASGEGGPNGSVNENLFFNNIPDDIEKNLEMIDELGGEKTFNHFPVGWAQAFCTPFKMFKKYTWNGGITDPMIIAWPKKLQDGGSIRHQYHHVSDIVPTIYEMLNIENPKEINGYAQKPIEGISMKYTFKASPEDETQKEVQYYSMLGTRGIWHKGWKANTVHPAVNEWSHFIQDEWQLYCVDKDRSETKNLAQKYPEKLEEMKATWFHEAGKYNGFPIDDRLVSDILNTPRPQMVKSKDHYVYYPNTSEVPESASANIRGRSFKVFVNVNIIAKPEGVLFAQGSLFGGQALYIKNGKLKYIYNYLGIEEFIIESKKEIPTGLCVVGVEFIKKELTQQCALGTLKLYINDENVAQIEDVKAQLGKFGLTGEGLCVGRDSAMQVTYDYPGNRPWNFTGGTIKNAIVDVSGSAYVDIEKEIIAMRMRD